MYSLDDLLSIRKDQLEAWIVTTNDKNLEEHLFVSACSKDIGVLPVDVQTELDKRHPYGTVGHELLQACVRDFEILPTDMQQIIEQYAGVALRELERLHKCWDREIDLEELTEHKIMLSRLGR